MTGQTAPDAEQFMWRGLSTEHVRRVPKNARALEIRCPDVAGRNRRHSEPLLAVRRTGVVPTEEWPSFLTVKGGRFHGTRLLACRCMRGAHPVAATKFNDAIHAALNGGSTRVSVAALIPDGWTD